MPNFHITYINPKTEEEEEKTVWFDDTPSCGITAKEWADDLGYSLADKGWYHVTEIGEQR